ncbi:MAG: hypothetical protein ACTH8F_03215 [Microbacterium sp.]
MAMAEQRIVSVDITYLVTAALAQHPTFDDEESHFAATDDA